MYSAAAILPIWNGQPLLGWDFASRGIEPKLRGPLAYFVGVRYEHVHKKPADAVTYYQKAQATPAAPPALRNLAAEAVKRLK
jgi:hypothetical protein